jgi:hypothetical protein
MRFLREDDSMKRTSRTKSVVLAALVALAAASCARNGVETAPEESASVAKGWAPMATDVNGIWLQVEDPGALGLLVRFNYDGTFAMDDAGDLTTSPAATGTFELDGHSITFTSEGSDLCTDGDSWTWQASLSEGGSLHIVEAADPCRTSHSTNWTLVRISPGSVSLRDGLADGPITAAAPSHGRPPTANKLAGVWLPIESQGLLVRFEPDGNIAVDNHGELDTRPAILGTYKLKGRSIIVTVRSGPACQAGDKWTWKAGLSGDGHLDTVLTERGTGNCARPVGTKWTFIRVSPSSEGGQTIQAPVNSG